MHFNFSWTFILQLPGFIKMAQDKCLHDDLLLGHVHHAAFYSDFLQSRAKNVVIDLKLINYNSDRS